MFCDHCYREAGAKTEEELSTEEGKVLLDEIKKAGFKIMIFSSGEPFMCSDIIELVRYASSIGLRPFFGTNGTLITPEIAKQLKEAGVMGVGISLDSLDKNKHDELRKLKGATLVLISRKKMILIITPVPKRPGVTIILFGDTYSKGGLITHA